jgi:hypothetical protein
MGKLLYGFPEEKILASGLSGPYFRSVFTKYVKKLKSGIRRLVSRY